MSELIEFYKEELVMLKQQLGDKTVALEKSEKEVQRLIQLVASLKENNDSLSEMFGEYKKFSSQQLEELEGRLAMMSVEKAEKVFQIDQMHQEMKKLRKSQSSEQKVEESPDNVSLASLEDSPQQRQIRIGEDISPEEFQQVKKSNQKYLSLFDQFAQNRKKRKQDIELLMDNLPTSVYKILYEDEMKKIKDTSGKQFEMQIWQDEVMSLFVNKVKNRKKIQDKLAQYVRNSFPEQFRGKIWSFLLGNKLKISKDLYEKILQSIPQHPLVNQELLTLINNDLQRTFQIINDFDGSDRLKDEMREVLIVFSIYRPDIGYVQGLTYIVFMFLIRMNKQKTFKCFANLLLSSDLLRSLYLFKGTVIDNYFQAFNLLLAQHLPNVYKHLEDMNIPKQSFLVEWFYTVFARAFNLIISSKVWDYFLCEGDPLIYRMCIAILSVIEGELLQADYEDALLLIRNCSFQLTDHELFKAMCKIKIDGKQLASRLNKEI